MSNGEVLASEGEVIASLTPSRQVAREFLFTQAQEFIKTHPDGRCLTRQQRRIVARQISNRTREKMAREGK